MVTSLNPTRRETHETMRRRLILRLITLLHVDDRTRGGHSWRIVYAELGDVEMSIEVLCCGWYAFHNMLQHIQHGANVMCQERPFFSRLSYSISLLMNPISVSELMHIYTCPTRTAGIGAETGRVFYIKHACMLYIKHSAFLCEVHFNQLTRTGCDSLL